MPKFNVDFSKKNADLIPEGVYLCVVDKVTAFIPTQEEEFEGKKPFLNWQFSLADEEYTGRKVWMKNFMTEAATFFLVNNLSAMGFEPDDKNNIEVVIDDATKLMTYPPVNGKLVSVKIIQNTFNKLTTNRAEKIVNSEGKITGDNGQEPLFK